MVGFFNVAKDVDLRHGREIGKGSLEDVGGEEEDEVEGCEDVELKGFELSERNAGNFGYDNVDIAFDILPELAGDGEAGSYDTVDTKRAEGLGSDLEITAEVQIGSEG